MTQLPSFPIDENFIDFLKMILQKENIYMKKKYSINELNRLGKLNNLFNPTSENICELVFSSPTLSTNELTLYARAWMHNNIVDYYESNYNRIGDKINVYKLNIDYDKVIKEIENPEFTKWKEEFSDSESDPEYKPDYDFSDE